MKQLLTESLPISLADLRSVARFFRGLDYESFVNRPLTGPEIVEITKLGTHQNLNFVLTGECRIELRYTQGYEGRTGETLRIDLTSNVIYMRLFGQLRGPLTIYDPASGQDLHIRPRIWAPRNATIETQEKWFACFRKPQPRKYEVRWAIISLNYMGEEYFEVQELLPVYSNISDEEFEDQAIALGLELLEYYFEVVEYPHRLNFTRNKNMTIKLGEVRQKLGVNELVNPTQGMVIDVRRERIARVLYDIEWKEQITRTMTGQEIRKINLLSITEIPLPSSDPRDVQRFWSESFDQKFGET